MAYLRELRRSCLTCRRRAAVELVNAQNAVVGEFCRPCGKRQLKQRDDDQPGQREKRGGRAEEREE